MKDPLQNIAVLSWPEGDAVHLWQMHVALAREHLAGLESVLSPQEQHRASRFRFERDRARFVASHGGMRVILAAYLDRPAAEIAFVQEARGKPGLDPSVGAESLRFNLSHSGDWAILTVAQHEVGADIEQVRPMVDVEQVAATVLSEAELAVLMRQEPDDRLACFLRMWTRKEAAVKATGAGLAAHLPEIDVDPADPAASPTFRVRWAAHGGPDLFGWSYGPLPDYHAAAVLVGAAPEVTVRDWPAQPS